MNYREIELKDFFNEKADEYDVVHLGHSDGGKIAKDILGGLLNRSTETILDLGIGTGIELEGIFARFPNAQVTGIDLAKNMTDKIADKFPDKTVHIINDSYFNFDFAHHRFDAIISAQSLHHFNTRVKAELFARIFEGLREGGVFVNSDYILSTQEEFFAKQRELEERLNNGELPRHIDTPFLLDNELRLLKDAGFSHVRKVWECGGAKVIVAEKHTQEPCHPI